QAGEELADLVEIVQLAPAALAQLPAPIDPHEEEERRLCIGDQSKCPVMPLPTVLKQCVHNDDSHLCSFDFVMSREGGRVDFCLAKPAQSGPSLEAMSDISRAIKFGDRTAPKAQVDGVRD